MSSENGLKNRFQITEKLDLILCRVQMVILFDQIWVHTIRLIANEGFYSIKTVCGLLRSDIQLNKEPFREGLE